MSGVSRGVVPSRITTASKATSKPLQSYTTKTHRPAALVTKSSLLLWRSLLLWPSSSEVAGALAGAAPPPSATGRRKLLYGKYYAELLLRGMISDDGKEEDER